MRIYTVMVTCDRPGCRTGVVVEAGSIVDAWARLRGLGWKSTKGDRRQYCPEHPARWVTGAARGGS